VNPLVISKRPLGAALFGTLLGAALLIGGCSSKKDTKKAAEKPAVLVPMTNRLKVQRIWATRVGGENPKLRLGLGVAADGNRVFAASHKGAVDAFDRSTGRRLWGRQLKAPLSGGPTAGNGMVLLGTSKGEVIALSESDGAPLWRVRINAEVLSGPSIGTDLVAVRGVDGKLRGLSAKDGSENWVVDQQVPRLSLRGTSQPLLTGDLAVSGFDNGRVVAVNQGNGTIVWDAAVGQSHGSTELARLIDVDAPVVGNGDQLFAVSYQGRVARLARDTGQIIWTRDTSSYRGLAIDSSNVYVSTADGNVVCLDRQNGTEQWTQKALVRRQLTAPVVYGDYVVVADAGGVIHWLDPKSGDFVARALVDKSGRSNHVTSKGISLKKRVSMEPIVAGDLLLVFTDSGLLSAFRAPPNVSH
jgi:outer membrane protein assembly factor BamB